MNPKASEAPLYLFAKAPVAGKVKTRMQPYLTADQSAQIATMFLEDIVATASSAWQGHLYIAYDGDVNHPTFQHLQKKYSLFFIPQGKGDLGERMGRCLQHGIAIAGKAAVMGCDVPHLTDENFKDLYRRMKDAENVVGPATDGGFYALGLGRFSPQLFNNISWGGSDVFAKLMHNAATLNWPFTKLSLERDLDTLEDLIWVSQRNVRYQRFLQSAKQ